MRVIKKFSTMLFAAGLFFITSCGGTAKEVLHGYTPPSLKNVSMAQISEVGSARPFNFRAAPGELLVVYFGYTNCPDMCPTFLVALKNAKRNIGELASKVDLAMVTVDPARDTSDILPRYLSSFTNRFHALIPSSDTELSAVKDAFQVTSSITEIDGKIDVVHSGTAYVVDSTGTVVLEWPFGLDTESMTNDLRILLTQPQAQSSNNETSLGETSKITVTSQWARTSPAATTMGAAYMTLNSTNNDALVSASVDKTVALLTEVHEIVMVNGAMKMQQVSSVPVVAGSATNLKPGGYHIMLMQLAKPLKTGNTFEVRLTFAKAGVVTVVVPIMEDAP